MQTDTHQSILTSGSTQSTNDQAEIQPTDRQRQMLELQANGLNQRQVAQAMGLSYETVHKQMRLVRDRLNVATVGQAIALATKRSWIRVDDCPRSRN